MKKITVHTPTDKRERSNRAPGLFPIRDCTTFLSLQARASVIGADALETEGASDRDFFIKEIEIKG